MPRRRGRPAFKATPALRRRVEQCRAVGMSKPAIAAALGISFDTLQKHFLFELDQGGAKRREEVVDMLHKAARRGSVSAQKYLREAGIQAAASEAFEQGMIDGAAAAAAAPPPSPEPAPKPMTKQGKKELANAEAKTAGVGTEWGADLQTPTDTPTDRVH